MHSHGYISTIGYSSSVFGDENLGSLVHGVALFNGEIFFTDSQQRKVYKATGVLGEKSVYLEGFDYLSDIQVVERMKGQ